MRRTTGRTDPPYLRIADEIRRRVADGRLRPGDRVPSARQITREWGVAIATATKVLATLQADGLVRAVAGVGTVVAEPALDDAPHLPALGPKRPGGPDGPHPGRRRAPHPDEPDLSRERVVAAAVGLADAEGIGAVSMRRVASDLGVATMSLYRYVASKDELLTLMMDAACAAYPPPEPPPPGWRAQLETASRLQWQLYRHSPWVTRVFSLTRPPLAPHAMAYTKWMLRAMAGVGLPPQAAVQITTMLAGYVRGIAVNLETKVEAQQDTGIDSEEWMASQTPVIGEIGASGRFPLLLDVATHHADLELDTIFELGLTLLLDGIAARLDEGVSRSRPT